MKGQEYQVNYSVVACGSVVSHTPTDIVFTSNFVSNETSTLFYTQQFDYSFTCSYRRKHEYAAPTLAIVDYGFKILNIYYQIYYWQRYQPRVA